MLSNPEFWVAVSFVLFLALLGYCGVHRMILGSLDARAARIRDELAQAQRLREEAQVLLSDAQRQQREAEEQATEIIALAREDARSLSVEARRKFDEFLHRRHALAELKIQQAVKQAVKEVRAFTADLAVTAATRIISETVKGAQADKLVDGSIAELESRLH